MFSLTILQHYWWFVISLLAALLVFLLFVQGGQTLLFGNTNAQGRTLMVNSLGRKWELTYTTLVMYGGAFFAAFPLYYSTCFGGAYWLWMLILVSFVLQAVSYEFRSKPGNLLSKRVYDSFLFFNGSVGTILIGVSVGMMYFGGDFTVDRYNLVSNNSPVISTWVESHGLDVILNWKCLLLGFMLLFLARTQAALYFINNINDARAFGVTNRFKVMVNGVLFAVLFIGFVVVLLRTPGLRYDPSNPDVITPVNHIYLHNMMDMWWTIPMFVGGALLVLYGIFRTAFSSRWRKGIWYSGVGTVLVVLVLFFIAGYNNTAYLPSLTNPHSSLTIANSSASQFSLTAMGYVSLVIPIVVGYIAYTWHRMDKRPLTISDLESDSHKY